MFKKFTLYTDGGARGNPGPAGIGAVIKQGSEILAEISEYIGKTTNNQAEYQALLAGLKKAKELGASEIECFLDSQLVVMQLNRKYKVKDKALAQIFLRVWNESQGFEKISFHYLPREKNKEADKLVNLALDREVAKTKTLF